MGFLSSIFGKKRLQDEDAERVYRAFMQQSRQPDFYQAGGFADSYDGRVDCLCLHLTFLMSALSQKGETAQTLSQAVFDRMVDDFDVALREEGLTDSGVKRRIKPMIAYFYGRMRDYREALPTGTIADVLTKGTVEASFALNLQTYAENLAATLTEASFGDIAKLRFSFPDLTAA